MKLRFKLRTLLIATALVAAPLGLQVHVHNKGKRFVEELRSNSSKVRERLTDAFGPGDYEVESARLKPASILDILYFKRRCKVEFQRTRRRSEYRFRSHHLYIHYVTCVGENIDPDKCFELWEKPLFGR